MKLAKFARTALLTALLTASPLADAELEDNTGYRIAFEAGNATVIAFLPTAFLVGPFATAADLIVTSTDIVLKNLPAVLVAPDDLQKLPNTPDGCAYVGPLPTTEGALDDLLGLFELESLPDDWGFLGTPVVDHRNTGVNLTLESPILAFREGDEVAVPPGRWPLTWRASTQLNLLFDVALPVGLFLFNAELKYGKAITETDPKSAARAQAIGKAFLFNLGIELGLIGADFCLGDPGRCDPVVPETLPTLAARFDIDTAEHVQERELVVLDTRPPTISTSLPDAGPFEAVDFGGIRRERIIDTLRSSITAGDPCDLPVLTGNDVPVLFPLGTSEVTWEAVENRPLGGGNPGRATVTQRVTVADTKPPILLAPPHRIVEAASAPSPASVLLGNAVVFDLADPDPLLDRDAPGAFPVDARTPVTWFAEDSSGLRAEKTQWVTVKTPGTNTAPSVSGVAAETLTSEPVDIVLSGTDGDFLSGTFDPINFEILVPPRDGFFVAPLLPYFIEDFRVRPGTLVGDIINNSGDPNADLAEAFCKQGEDVPIDFVKDPEYVAVLDDGTSYVLDAYYLCTSGNSAVVSDERLSKWSAEGELLDQRTDIPSSVTRLTFDRDGFLYFVSPETSQNKLSMRRIDPATLDLESIFFFERPTSFGQPAGRLRYGRVDSEAGIVYATDRERLFAYDLTEGGQNPAYLGAFLGGQRFLVSSTVAGSSNRGYHVEVDREGFVYVADSGGHRIYQFAPAMRTGSGVELGELVGWLGRCDSGPNCDDENGRSFGYSCTDASCAVSERGGSAPGQFDRPAGLALDGDDILYVTDYENQRVQRFTPLGDFAGEAGSTCDGSCFVLGDMGRPLDISVNDTQFFVLDRERSLMHVFETAPFQDITENSVTVRYTSDNGFQGMDEFTFRASDGLADSNVGTAMIEVERNFRPPVLEAQSFELFEDLPGTITLEASDPDGILGVDFNGLDALTWELLEPPDHGALEGILPKPRYLPEADFNGKDRFVVRVSDGVFTTEPATITLDVRPVNDAPVARFTAEESRLLPEGLRRALASKAVGVDLEAGLGYPVPLFGEYDDPDLDEVHFTQVTWEPGVVQVSRTNAPPPDGDGDGLVITPAFGAIGQVLGRYVYLTPGPKDVELCVFDRVSQFCIETAVSVVPMVDLAIDDVTDRDEPADTGEPVSLALTVLNAPPDDSVAAQPATGVLFTATVPAGVSVADLETDRGVCEAIDGEIRCMLGTLAAGEAANLALHFVTALDYDPETAPINIDVTGNERDPTGDNETKLELPVRSQRLFADGFE